MNKMFVQLTNKTKSNLIQSQITNAILLKSNAIITSRIQLRNLTNDSNGKAKVKDIGVNTTSKYEALYDEELDNPKPLAIFENVKKEAETDKIRNRIYAFPNVREDMFKGVKRIKMKELLCKFYFKMFIK